MRRTPNLQAIRKKLGIPNSLDDAKSQLFNTYGIFPTTGARMITASPSFSELTSFLDDNPDAGLEEVIDNFSTHKTRTGPTKANYRTNGKHDSYD